MIKPVIFDELFEINDGLTPEFNNGVIIIDNFYKNYSEIYEMLNNCSVNRWKSCEGSRNFVDYYDCRIEYSNVLFGESYVTKICSLIDLIKYFFEDNREIGIHHATYQFNVYQNIKKDIPSTLQHVPHVDNTYNAIVYLDKICSGGTSIYPTINDMPDNVGVQNILYDVSNLDKLLIESKPNRLAIFEGTRYHGGYIKDHNVYTGENWRINQVMFFHEINNRTERV